MSSDPLKHSEEVAEQSAPLTGFVLGPYKVGARIGSGGMGEVYRAHDLSLNRDVALKVLPPLFAHDTARLARFRREAQLLASLNHPNIAAIYGFEEARDVHALVLELVEGPTLADRIARGPIPLRDALPIARQIAVALETAHQQGIVHRDLKPANIKVRADGTVKVLDFGLAKALDPAASIDGETTAPATTSPALTGIGVLLGTAAYMSPEQARGYPADKRSDVWAFGAVLYEMLTGRRAFTGDAVSDTLAAVLRDEPDWSALPSDVPSPIRTLLEGCLQKDRKACVSDIATVRFLTDNQHTIGLSPKSTTPGKRRNRIALTTMVALTAAAIAGVAAWSAKPTAMLGRVTRFVIPMGEGRQLSNRGRQMLAISLDGTKIVYVANQRLYLRLMSEVDARPLVGTEALGGITNPAFSPDGQSVAFWSSADRTLKRIAIAGGRAITICQAQNPFGLSWDRESLIFGQREGIMQVSAESGQPSLLVTSKRGEFVYDPQVLPGDRGTLFTVADTSTLDSGYWDDARIVVQTTKDQEPKIIIKGGSDARYLPTGHIVYALGGRLFAVPFDLTRLEVRGGPVPILEGIARAGNVSPAAQFSVSETGSLVYLPGPLNPTSEPSLRLAWLDRTGKTEMLKLRPGLYESPRISPDGQRVAYGASDNSGENIWVYDLSETSDARRLTFGGRNRFPVWSADGLSVAFQSDREGDAAIFLQRAEPGSTAIRLTTPEKGTVHVPESWRLESDVLALSAQDGNRRYSLRLLTVRDGKEGVFPSVAPSEVPPSSVFSPDGRWLAYTSGTFGERTVFIHRFPPTGDPQQVSVGPLGYRPMWSRDGKELFYVNTIGSSGPANGTPWVAVKITTDPTFKVSSPEPVPNGGLVIGRPSQGENLRNYDMGPNGKRLGLVMADASSDLPDSAEQLQVVLNWTQELKQRVPIR